MVDGLGKEEKLKRPRKRPDGTNEKDYLGCERWSPKRWAWEFLRRNPDFAAEAKEALNQGEAEQRVVAVKYGLRRFKPAEGYKGPHGLPLFLGSSIRSRTYWDESLLQLSKMKIKQSQILIVFDMEMIMSDRRSLRAQLGEAEKRLRKRLSELESMRERRAEDHKPKWNVLKTYLRLLDLKDVGNKSRLESILIVDKVYQEAFKMDPKAARADIHSFATAKFKKAKAYASEGYRYLANMNHRVVDKST
ncbi:MAG: hypothetical protein IV101_03895 [Dechloromonas sp.]|uniref:transcriptional regulator domain-containing protein n=1 Tax=Dechloromonas sp. TaxID=1917218 RepID=UPI0027F90FCA|nr:DUF6499 domain-containing protein [Dechloromonas sp.]MBT9520015.1 hypothetical protein [Dechloromonas sp.]